jgi:hypothetical protein
MMSISARPHPSAIRSPLGNAETADDVCGGELIDNAMTKPCRTAQREI